MTLVGIMPALASMACAAAVHAQVDSSVVSTDQSFTLQIDSDDAQSAAQPDLAPLRKDFDILGTSTSSQTSFVNGTRTDSRSWSIQLLPRRAGKLTIPPLTVGTEHTAGVDVAVTAPSSHSAGGATRHVFLEIDTPAAASSLYVQQQFPYTVRLYYDDTVQSGELSAPAPTDAIVDELGGDKHFSVVRDGRQYHVTERHYAIAAERSGSLKIPPAHFEGEMVVDDDQQNDGGDMMSRLLRNSPLANDPFFKNAFQGNLHLGMPTRAVAANGREVAVHVDPRPAGAVGAWLPADQITLHDSWTDNPPHLTAGEPVTRIITIDAKGLAGSQIPQLQLADDANARLYPEPPQNQSRTDGKTIFGTSTQRITYIARSQGLLAIAPVDLAWWNTVSNVASHARLPGHEFPVAAGVASASAGLQLAPAATPAATAAAPMPPAEHPADAGPWTPGLREFGLVTAAGAVLLALATLIVIAARRRSRRALASGKAGAMQASRPQAAPHEATSHAALRALQQACAANDHRGAASALMALSRTMWPKDGPPGLAALAARVQAGREEIRALDRSLYGNAGDPWDGAALAKATREGLRPARAFEPPPAEGLDALYPPATSAGTA